VRREAKRALEAGLNLMIFSDNVPLEDEVYLKGLAEERGLLVMGPDCGTAILGGLGLAFSNVVARGPVGIVGASGTGIQAASVLIDRAGSGISHAIGTGGRDLSEEVGGRTMIQGIRLLAEDEGTRALLLLSKPPHPKVMERVLEAARGCGRPAVVLFLGADRERVRQFGATPAADLEEAALLAVELAQGKETLPSVFQIPPQKVQAGIEEERGRLSKGARFVRGLYSGGTLCEEALLILQDSLGLVHSNVPLRPEGRLEDPRKSRDHSVIDLGEDFFTRGRPHPMIDPGLRNEQLLREAEDPTVAIFLLDVVLGYGAHPDPAGELAKAIQEAKRRRGLCVVASVCGTERDPQRLSRQEAALREAGARLFPSNAQAARFAGRLARTLLP
jgi:FdrA protein